MSTYIPPAPETAKRDCTCPRVHHKHGTWTGYCTDDCRCAPCTAAWTRYCRQLRKRRHLCGGTMFIDGTGAARRLQALAARGWGSPDLMPYLGVSSTFAIDSWRRGVPKMRRATHARIVAVYDELWDKPAPGRYARKVRNYAAAQGWVPPLAWDDDEIDNPAAVPFVNNPTIRHGTRSGAVTHRSRGELPCTDCVEAERAHERRRYHERKGAA